MRAGRAQSAQRWSCDATLIVTLIPATNVPLSNNLILLLSDEMKTSWGVRVFEQSSHPSALLQLKDQVIRAIYAKMLTKLKALID